MQGPPKFCQATKKNRPDTFHEILVVFDRDPSFMVYENNPHKSGYIVFHSRHIITLMKILVNESGSSKLEKFA